LPKCRAAADPIRPRPTTASSIDLFFFIVVASWPFSHLPEASMAGRKQALQRHPLRLDSS
jgi:hypothetical protein